ncbi:MAG: hypothetical protein KGI27_02620 [Thaumarchaeota archaeon]|nr:hypothetical protein [Nitrososphaerota archaeon]
MTQKKNTDVVENTDTKLTVSVCDIMHANATDIIEKMESLVPTNMQMYSDFYTEWLHSLQDLFGVCYMTENEILSKIGMDRRTLQSFGAYAKTAAGSAITQIEMANNIQKTYLQIQISAVKTMDEYIRFMLDGYSKMLANSLGISKKFQ